jgi:hypothetical protein
MGQGRAPARAWGCEAWTGNHEPEGDDGDAARAFEALREEVAALRRGVELVYRQGQQAAPGAPDYSPTLGKMEQALQAIAGRLEAVERQPALMLTPASFRMEIDTVVRSAVTVVSRPVVDAVHAVQSVTRDLEALAGAGACAARTADMAADRRRAWPHYRGGSVVRGGRVVAAERGRLDRGVADRRQPVAGGRDPYTGSQSRVLGQDGAALHGVRRAGDRVLRGGDHRAGHSARAGGRKECLRAECCLTGIGEGMHWQVPRRRHLTECAFRQKSDPWPLLAEVEIEEPASDGQSARLRGHWATLPQRPRSFLAADMQPTAPPAPAPACPIFGLSIRRSVRSTVDGVDRMASTTD